MNIISGQKLLKWYQKAEQEANKEKINLIEIELLITELTQLDSLALKLKTYQNKTQINSKVSLKELEKIWQLRREKRCPIQYLIGECHWRNFRLKVTPDVLIPRPETELIIDLAQEIALENPHFLQGKLLDLGTGSGAIALGLAQIFPEAQIYAIDRSAKALEIAEENALKHDLQTKIKFGHGSWFNPVKEQKKTFSMIISNPPYIPSELILQLQPEVVNHEPKIALDGGQDGLDDIRHLIKSAPAYLIDGGFILLEIMAGQGEQVKKLFEDNGNYINVNIHLDLAGCDRFVVGQLQ